MGLETATYINGLVTTNPLGADVPAQGDDHIRLIKSTLKNSFPGVSGPVAATHTNLDAGATLGATYDEDTWLPEVRGSTTAGVTTYATARVGRWTRLGNRILFNCHVQWTAATGTGNIEVTLPFAAAGSRSYALSIAVSGLSYTAGNSPQAFIAAGDSFISIQQAAPGGTTSGIPMDNAATIIVAGICEI